MSDDATTATTTNTATLAPHIDGGVASTVHKDKDDIIDSLKSTDNIVRKETQCVQNEENGGRVNNNSETNNTHSEDADNVTASNLSPGKEGDQNDLATENGIPENVGTTDADKTTPEVVPNNGVVETAKSEKLNVPKEEDMCVDDVEHSDSTVMDQAEIKCDGDTSETKQIKEVESADNVKSSCKTETEKINDVEEKKEGVKDMEVDMTDVEKVSKDGVNESCSKSEELISKDANEASTETKLAIEKVLTGNGDIKSMDIPKASTSSSNISNSVTGDQVENSEKHKCSTCNFVTKDKSVFDNHSCDKDSKSKDNKDKDSSDDKKYQIFIAHDKEKDSFVCKECDFTNKGHGFEEHLMCHLMLRPYQCLYCKECFINRREISRHVLKVHNGAKMSCALRALKRAKAIIKEVTNTGVLYFMARVPGKVPLEKDPDRKREVTMDTEKKEEGEKEDKSKLNSDVEQLANKEKTLLSQQQQQQHQQQQQQQQQPEGDKVSEKKSQSEKMKVNESERKSEDEIVGDKGSKSPRNPETLNTSVSTSAFSKLREVLTSSKSPELVKDHEKHNSSKSGNLRDNSSSTVPNAGHNSSKIKILASYSLHDDSNNVPSSSSSSSHSSSLSPSKDTGNKSMVPNFIMSSPSNSPQNEPETLSFLGPERPIFKPASPSNSHSILPPPSLKPAPKHSNSNTSSSSVSKSLPPPPQLASAPAPPKQTIKTSDFFICGFDCSFTCINKSSLLQHLKDIHSSRPDFPCHYCAYRDVSEDGLVNHVAEHADSHDKTKPLYACAQTECAFTSNMLTDFINHTKTSHEEEGNNLTPTCKVCGIKCLDIAAFQRHLEENIIHIVNCPHCPSKATERRAILNHISSNHPGKPKMVSVAKQLICNARRENGYWKTKHGVNQMPPPSRTPAPLLGSSSSSSSSASSSSTSVIDTILRRAANQMTDDYSNNTGDNTPDSHSPRSESSGMSGIRVKEELEERDSMDLGNAGDNENENSNYVIDEHGVRRRIYVPMSERQAENFRCNYCTFVARDVKRLACHERSHGMPPTRKDRFKCMFCPQGFDSELKFRLHITCHPGLIKFLLYKCKKCEFDSNQKHTIIKHITCNRDKKHRGHGPVEDQYTIISRSLESRVLECEQCRYMTRHKIHMAIHYQREHGILRDKSDFRIEGLTPHDTPFSGHDSTPIPDSPGREYTRPTYKKSKYNNPDSSPSAASGGEYMSLNEINDRNELFIRLVSQQSALQPGHVLENQARKFKCPICKYLLPKAADLKNHVKRHSEVGQITLLMFRCKYCSCMSTAREMLYDHLGEKHPGKPIALVKKIVFIDTTDVDKSFAETAVEENLQQLEESVHNEIMSAINSNVSSKSNNQSSPSSSPSPKPSFEQLFVIPEGGETFAAALHCPKCTFSSHNRHEIIFHVTSTHPEVKVISSDEDVEKLAKATTKDLHRSKGDKSYQDSSYNPDGSSVSSNAKSEATAAAQAAWLDTIEEVLIVPDDQLFKEPALCSRCDFSTISRKEMVTHLQQYHTEIAVMGRNSYPIQVSAIGSKIGMMAEPCDDSSCVVGSGSLDNKLRCLYENYGSQMKCLICGVDRPKKFFIHVHILRHLNIFLWKCSFCAHRGLQKYKMVDHIKKVHPGKPMSVRYLRVNVESRVSQFLSQFNVLQNAEKFQDGENENSNSNEGEFGSGGGVFGLGGAGIEGAIRGGGDDNEGGVEFHDDEYGANTSTNDPDGGVMSIQTSTGSTYVLGADPLDEKISCLYEMTPQQTYRCLACVNQFQRKFAIHRHIIITHLKVALLSCDNCGMQGVEKHQMVDHSLACHPTEPVSFQNNSVDLDKAVSAFLAESCHVEKRPGLLSDTEKTDLIELMKSWNASNKNQFRGFNPQGVKIKRSYTKRKSNGDSPLFGPPAKKANVSSGYKSRTIVDPGVIMLGREALDIELSCLYQSRGGGHFRCLICRWEFPRKYPLHRHIMLKHLRMNLVACPYCPYEGVEKYTVSTHIKEEHKDQPVSIRYVQPDVGGRVRDFVEDIASGISTSQDLIRRPGFADLGSGGRAAASTSSLSALIKMKREKNFDDLGDDGNGNDDENMDDNCNDDEKGPSSSSGQGLVVAMFGKKKKSKDDGDGDNQDDIVVKTEVDDESFAEGSKLEDEDNDDENVNVFFGPSTSTPTSTSQDKIKTERMAEEEEDEKENEEGGGEGQVEQRMFFEEEELMDGVEGGGSPAENDLLSDKEARMKAIREKFLKSQSYGAIKRPQAYAPGSYRTPNGGKPKALDVITQIKVLKVKDGPINKFGCEKCTFTSVHRSNVVRHIYKIHEKYQTHVCPICNYQTLSLILMQTHMGKSHPGVEYTEESFNINPPRSKPRSKPLMGPLSFQRRKQPKYTSYPPLSASNADTSSSSAPKQYACAYCHYETNTQGDILAHTREKHTDAIDDNTNSVNNNNKNGNNMNNGEFLDQEMETASDACWEKSKKAVKRRVPDNNMLISGMVRSKRKFVFEKGEDLVQCGYCEVRETSMGRMQHHFEWEHPTAEVKCKRIPAWRFVCKTCSVKTMATSKMKYHLNRHVGYRPYTCTNCGAFFPSPDQCRRHARSSRHEEQYVYIHNVKKEQRVEELLQATRQLALKIQEDAALDPDFDIGQIDSFLARYQDVKHNLKRVGVGSNPRSTSSKKSRSSYNRDEDYKTRARPPAKSIQTLGVEMDVTIQCYICKKESNTIHQTFLHHQEAHKGQRFLWTELERGFTCDRSGEAILDSSSFPSASEEVGYSTKMTLGHGSKTMRFKCKSCEFSSCVIQAMKSHLKSHQPKGFICPYCSRSFSGKEKLMRHQYCLHKGMASWVIHLRKASPTTRANTVLPATVEVENKSVVPVNYICNKCPFTSQNFFKYRRHLGVHKEFLRNLPSKSVAGEDGLGSKSDGDGLEKTKNDAVTSNEEHADDNGGDSAKIDEGEDVGKESGSGGFKCGHCEFSAPEKDEVEDHHNAEHPDDELMTIDLRHEKGALSTSSSNSGSNSNSNKKKRSGIVLNLDPKVKLDRVSKSTLELYHEDEAAAIKYYQDYGYGDEEEEEMEEGVEGEGEEQLGENDSMNIHEEGLEEHSELFSDETFPETDLGNEDGELDEDDDEEEEEIGLAHENISEADDSNSNTQFDDNYRMEHQIGEGNADKQSLKFKVKFPGAGLKTKDSTLINSGVSDSGSIHDDDDDYEGEDKDIHDDIENQEEMMDDDEEDEEEELEDDYHEGVSSPIAEDSQELARQLGLVENQTISTTSNLLGGGDDDDDSGMMIMEFNGMKSRGGSSPTSSLTKEESENNFTKMLKKDKNVSDEVGEEYDDDDDDEDEEFDDVNVSLSSPLPMISLGDGMEFDDV